MRKVLVPERRLVLGGLLSLAGVTLAGCLTPSGGSVADQR
ncbi:MAG: hypothetical protein RL477_2263, partial [Pseudomonadota bacterium]